MPTDDLSPHAAEPDGGQALPPDSAFTIEDAPDETPEETIKRLAALPAIKYENARVAEAKRIGWRVARLDRFVEAERGTDARPGQRQIEIPDTDPWPTPVKLHSVLDDAAGAVRRHVIMSPHASDLVALWISHTYVYTKFQHTPRLAITSPVKRCGKSTLIDVLRTLSRRPLKADSISAAGVYRTIEVLRPLTLMIDEADTFLRDNEELRGVLNSGFDQSGQVIRVVEIAGGQVPTAFETFAPVVLAAIGNLPSTLNDRSVPITLQRKGKDEAVQKLRDNGNRDALTTIARKLARWAADADTQLADSPAIPDALNDREADITIPLLSIADAAGGAWPRRARAALVAIFAERARTQDAEEFGPLLLADIRTTFDRLRIDRLTSAEIIAELHGMEERPWPEFGKSRRPISAPQMARLLKPFLIVPGTIRTMAGTVKGYHRSKMEDAFAKYLRADPAPDQAGSAAEGDEVLI